MKKKNNSGAAIIMVIVAIAFIGALVGMIVYMAFCNYKMKATDRTSKDNFYSAETALDVVNAGLQQDVSDSMAEAYVSAMSNSVGKSETQMSIDFQNVYLQKLQERLAEPTNISRWSLSHLQGFINSDSTDFYKTSKTNNITVVLEPIGVNELEKIDGKFITLKNIRITCTDNNGYVSIIETDIRIKIPDINYGMATNRLEIENYALIANNRLINDPGYTDGNGDHAGGSTDTTITGNVFGGNDGIYVKNTGSLSFIDDTTDTLASYYLIANSFNVKNVKNTQGIKVDNKHLNYVGGINVITGNINLDGSTYVSDDLTIDGNSCNVKVSGTYYGYGDSLDGADNSSSIVVNGANTSLDFSQLTDLSLSGHAYVGARHYDADLKRNEAAKYDNKNVANDDDEDFFDASEDYVQNIETYDNTLKDNVGYKDTDDSVKRNNSDVILGESISVKASSMLYMVPSDCMGFVAETGEQVMAKNPMTYEDYKLLTETTVKQKQPDGSEKDVPYYQPVNLSNLWSKLGETYTNSYKVIFRRVSGNVLAYFYLDFGTNEYQANSFFKAYYNYDKEGLTKYVKSYVPSIRWNPSLGRESYKYLTLAGNAFYFNAAGELVLQNDTLNEDSEKLEKAIKNSELYSDTFLSLMHMLKPTITETTTMQQSQTIFENIVDIDAVNNKIKSNTFKDETDSIEAIVNTGDYVYDGNPKIKLIIALGNVYLRSNFDGLVLAGKNIYVGGNCKKITYNPTEVLKALRTKCDDNFYAYEALGDSGIGSYAEPDKNTKDENVDLGSLVVYQYWKKE